MSSNGTGFWQLATLTLLLGTAFQACGGLNDAQVTVIPDGATGDAGMNASGGGSEGNGGASNAAGDANMTGDAGAMTGSGGSGEGACTADKPCGNGSEPGICVDGTCAACEEDAAGDEACATAYGEGHLCIGSACTEGECRLDAECTGGECLDNRCEACNADSDCLQPDTVCKVDTGACVTNASCGVVKNGAACPINDQDLCCAAANAICEAVECCGTSPCSTGGGGGNIDGACTNGHCVLAGCSAPPLSTRYVDFDAPNGGSGSKDCPYRGIIAAFKDLESIGGTVVVKSGSAGNSEGSVAMGPGITLVGSDASFNVCTKASCADDAAWPTITTGDARALILSTPGVRNIRFMKFVGLDEAMKNDATYSGIYVSTASLDIDHVDISGYLHGLRAGAAGSISIGPGLSAHHNKVGLYISDGDASAGGTVAITVAAGGDKISFNANNFGISCHGNGELTIDAPPTGPQAPGLVTVNNNDGSGLYYPSHNEAGDIVGLEAAGNGGGDDTLDQHDGATIFAKAAIKIRDSYFHDNVHQGVHIPGNGENTPASLALINLGINAGNGAGRNTFVGNKDTGICLEAGPANGADPNTLNVAGNYFRASGGDCTAGGTYKRAKTCTGGVDYAGACAGAANFTNCTPTPAQCQ